MADPTALPKPNPPLLMSKHWEGEFSRFFIFLQEHSFSVGPRPLVKATPPHGGGAWLTASSPATIIIVKAASHAAAILSVSVSGCVHEEHIISNLRLTWPQIACEPLCPTRGSRVVFVSYSDSFNQLQKFAVRFQSSADAVNFIRFFKDSSRDIMDIVAPASDFMCDSSSPSEMIASHAFQYKFDEGRSNEESADRYESHFPPLLLNKDINNTAFSHAPLSFTELLDNCSRNHENGILLNKDINNTAFSHAPLSFTELLTNCSRTHENEISMQLENASHIPKSGENASSQSPQDVSEQLGLEEDIKDEIARYMADTSFQDMLFRVEKVIHGLAADLPF